MVISDIELETLINKCKKNTIIPVVNNINEDIIVHLTGSTSRTNYYTIYNKDEIRIGSMILRFYEEIMFVQNIFIKEEFRRSGIATKAILELCRLGKCNTIIGKIVIEAIPFWAKLSNDKLLLSYKDSLHECLIPFKFEI